MTDIERIAASLAASLAQADTQPGDVVTRSEVRLLADDDTAAEMEPVGVLDRAWGMLPSALLAHGQVWAGDGRGGLRRLTPIQSARRRTRQGQAMALLRNDRRALEIAAQGAPQKDRDAIEARLRTCEAREVAVLEAARRARRLGDA